MDGVPYDLRGFCVFLKEPIKSMSWMLRCPALLEQFERKSV